jgi:hypothetical protein
MVFYLQVVVNYLMLYFYHQVIMVALPLGNHTGLPLRDGVATG